MKSKNTIWDLPGARKLTDARLNFAYWKYGNEFSIYGHYFRFRDRGEGLYTFDENLLTSNIIDGAIILPKNIDALSFWIDIVTQLKISVIKEESQSKNKLAFFFPKQKLSPGYAKTPLSYIYQNAQNQFSFIHRDKNGKDHLLGFIEPEDGAESLRGDLTRLHRVLPRDYKIKRNSKLISIQKEINKLQEQGIKEFEGELDKKLVLEELYRTRYKKNIK
jgi:hypothetical protein